MSYIGSWKVDDLLTFYAQTQVFATGVATDADAVPAYRVYEDETTTPLLTGNMALLDSANTAGLYSEQITLSAANGFEKGKCYAVHIAATVSGVVGATRRTFQMEAEVDANVVSGAVPSVTGAVGSVTGAVGSVTGAVGSVTGAVGSVTGAVGSVTGNVGGNVTGTVGSVVGAVGSVTGNVGGNVTGTVGSVVGAVGSVTGNVGGNVTGSVGSVVGAVGSVTGLTAADVGTILGIVNSGTFGNAALLAGIDDLAAMLVIIETAVDDLETRFSAALAAKLAAHAAAVLVVVVGAGSTTTTVKLSTVEGAAPSAVDDFYNGAVFVSTSGALAGQRTSISDYVGATTTATVVAMTGAPADTTVGVIV